MVSSGCGWFTASAACTRIRSQPLKTGVSAGFLLRAMPTPGTYRDQPSNALCRQSIRASASNGFLSKQNEPLAAALISSPGSATAVIMMTGTGESRDASNRLTQTRSCPACECL